MAWSACAETNTDDARSTCSTGSPSCQTNSPHGFSDRLPKHHRIFAKGRLILGQPNIPNFPENRANVRGDQQSQNTTSLSGPWISGAKRVERIFGPDLVARLVLGVIHQLRDGAQRPHIPQPHGVVHAVDLQRPGWRARLMTTQLEVN